MGRTRDRGLDGLLVVDKPAGCTSHDVVFRIRRATGQPRAGHSGTLDPDATGVLLVGLGKATRLLPLLTALPKTYVGEVVFGIETTTLDAAGEVRAQHDMSALTLDEVRAGVRRFVGPIEQVPPMVSAVQIGGKRLHELARQGIEVERAARPVTVFRFEVSDEVERLHHGPVVRVEVECSSGTYIRTLADDLGHSLGGGAHLRNLRRTAIGSFGVDEAVALDEVTVEQVMEPRVALRDYPSVTVGPTVEVQVMNGRVLDAESLGIAAEAAQPGSGPWAVCSVSGALLAVYERQLGKGTFKPLVVVGR